MESGENPERGRLKCRTSAPWAYWGCNPLRKQVTAESYL